MLPAVTGKGHKELDIADGQLASMRFESFDLLDETEMHGEVYVPAYEKGFWDALDLYHKYNSEATEERDKIARLSREAEKRHSLRSP